MLATENATIHATETEPLRVAIVEDDRPMRQGLSLLIDGMPGFSCVASYGSVESALRDRLAEAPHVMLLDIHLPGMLGPEGVGPLLAEYPQLVILMLTVYEDEDLIFQSLCNGACGYLLKKTPPTRLMEAIREARQGGSPMSPEIARKVVRLFRKTAPPTPVDHGLTPQEIRLLSLLAEGNSYKSAGLEMHVSINTVRNYIRAIYDKLHVHSKSAAVSKALKAGII